MDDDAADAGGINEFVRLRVMREDQILWSEPTNVADAEVVTVADVYPCGLRQQHSRADAHTQRTQLVPAPLEESGLQMLLDAGDRVEPPVQHVLSLSFTNEQPERSESRLMETPIGLTLSILNCVIELRGSVYPSEPLRPRPRDGVARIKG